MPGKLNVKVGWVGAKGELKEELESWNMVITNLPNLPLIDKGISVC